jgi:hypothetical protein
MSARLIESYDLFLNLKLTSVLQEKIMTKNISTEISVTAGCLPRLTRPWIIFFALLLAFIRSVTAFAGTVTVSQTSPANGASLASPVQISASAATTSGTITGWKVYDNGNTTSLNSTNSVLNGSLSLTTGTHTLITRAWDSAGDFGDQTRTITVTQATSGFDPYPPTADKLSNLDQAAWTDFGGCGPGCGTPTIHSVTPVSTPSLDGMAMSFLSSDSSGKFVGDLASTHLTSTDATNWISDYYEYLNVAANIAPSKGIVALEVDGNQTGTGNFVFGTECNYGYNPSQKIVWRFWTTSGGAETWGTTATPCPLMQAKHWYHVQVHFIRLSSSTYQVARLKVTDVTDNNTVVQDVSDLGTFNSTGSDISHGNGVDVQLDVQNDSFTVVIDKWTLVRW